MARKPRFSPGRFVYHVMNGTWPGNDLFEDANYEAFERVLVERTLTSITTSTFDPANRLLVQNSSGTRTSYSYDNYGNRTLKQAGAVRTTYAWDDDHRLSQAVLSDGKARKFTYNGDGLRNSRALVSARTTFAWNGQILVGEKDQDGAQRAYTQGPGGFGDLMNRYKSAGPANDYPLYDALGSVIRLTDQSQVVTATGAYDAWGKVLVQADPNLEYVARLGYYYDPELGLYYIRQRWYDPASKQWVSPDPVGSFNAVRSNMDEPLANAFRLTDSSAPCANIPPEDVPIGCDCFVLFNRPTIKCEGYGQIGVTVDAGACADFRCFGTCNGIAIWVCENIQEPFEPRPSLTWKKISELVVNTCKRRREKNELNITIGCGTL